VREWRLAKLGIAIGRESEGGVRSHARKALAEGIEREAIRQVRESNTCSSDMACSKASIREQPSPGSCCIPFRLGLSSRPIRPTVRELKHDHELGHTCRGVGVRRFRSEALDRTQRLNPEMLVRLLSHSDAPDLWEGQ